MQNLIGKIDSPACTRWLNKKRRPLCGNHRSHLLGLSHLESASPGISGNDRRDNSQRKGASSWQREIEVHGSHIQRHKTVFFLIFSIILPEANFKDLDKLDEDIKKQAVFYGIKEVK